jgi:hypothetical protein
MTIKIMAAARLLATRFEDMTAEQQGEYLKEHPNSEFSKSAKPPAPKKSAPANTHPEDRPDAEKRYGFNPKDQASKRMLDAFHKIDYNAKSEADLKRKWKAAGYTIDIDNIMKYVKDAISAEKKGLRSESSRTPLDREPTDLSEWR